MKNHKMYNKFGAFQQELGKKTFNFQFSGDFKKVTSNPFKCNFDNKYVWLIKSHLCGIIKMGHRLLPIVFAIRYFSSVDYYIAKMNAAVRSCVK